MHSQIKVKIVFCKFIIEPLTLTAKTIRLCLLNAGIASDCQAFYLSSDTFPGYSVNRILLCRGGKLTVSSTVICFLLHLLEAQILSSLFWPEMAEGLCREYLQPSTALRISSLSRGSLLPAGDNVFQLCPLRLYHLYPYILRSLP